MPPRTFPFRPSGPRERLLAPRGRPPPRTRRPPPPLPSRATQSARISNSTCEQRLLSQPARPPLRRRQPSPASGAASIPPSSPTTSAPWSPRPLQHHLPAPAGRAVTFAVSGFFLHDSRSGSSSAPCTAEGKIELPPITHTFSPRRRHHNSRRHASHRTCPASPSPPGSQSSLTYLAENSSSASSSG